MPTPIQVYAVTSKKGYNYLVVDNGRFHPTGSSIYLTVDDIHAIFANEQKVIAFLEANKPQPMAAPVVMPPPQPVVETPPPAPVVMLPPSTPLQYAELLVTAAAAQAALESVAQQIVPPPPLPPVPGNYVEVPPGPTAVALAKAQAPKPALSAASAALVEKMAKRFASLN